ncbi:hypothetical protein ACP70R_038040 [Stipagrostis hirtigluma subsp. patula]
MAAAATGDHMMDPRIRVIGDRYLQEEAFVSTKEEYLEYGCIDRVSVSQDFDQNLIHSTYWWMFMLTASNKLVIHEFPVDDSFDTQDDQQRVRSKVNTRG